MNMERSIPTNDPQHLPSSPKKKLHTKDKGSTLADTISNARASLKNGKDISARNLMECTARKPFVLTREPSFEFDPNLAPDGGSESTTEEIVALEEEHTDFLSTGGADGFNDNEYDDDDDDEETIVEEVVEEYYEEEIVVDDEDDEGTEGSLEPLPPPIVIPKKLRVRDSDDEDDDDSDDDDDDSEDDEDDSLPSVDVAPKKQPNTNITSSSKTTMVNQPKVTATPTKKETNLATPTPSTKRAVNEVQASNLSTSSTAKAVVKSNNELRSYSPAPNVASSAVDDEIDKKVATAGSLQNESATEDDNDENVGSVWEKPEWTKNNRLRATGISPARNLAKPITQLPELVSKKEMNDIKTPKKSNTMQAKLTQDQTQTISMMKYPKSPQVSTTKVSMSSMNAPKSAPQMDGGRKKYVVPTVPTTKDDIGSTCTNNSDKKDEDNDDDYSSKIAWEKPEWAKKKVLRKTSKTETILSGGKLERPIGGIRPIE